MTGAFFLAMALYPEVQKKAQQELDAVVGGERLPDFSDRQSLPYINALVKELLRWHPATPMGVPHRILADDEYNGHIIPAGATIFVNMWYVRRSWSFRGYAQYRGAIQQGYLARPSSLPPTGRLCTRAVLAFSWELGRPWTRSR